MQWENFLRLALELSLVSFYKPKNVSDVNGNLGEDSKFYAHYAKALYFMLFYANFAKNSDFMLF